MVASTSLWPVEVDPSLLGRTSPASGFSATAGAVVAERQQRVMPVVLLVSQGSV